MTGACRAAAVAPEPGPTVALPILSPIKYSGRALPPRAKPGSVSRALQSYNWDAL